MSAPPEMPDGIYAQCFGSNANVAKLEALMTEYGDARAAHARKQALEEAKRACFDKSKEFGNMDGYKRESDAAYECGQAIRSLK